nr:replication protein A 70 kDa DNA-binding subunit D-like [Ipomoea batatas]
MCGLAMIFKIAIRNEQFDNLYNAFAVMKIINDHALVDAHCPELLYNQYKGLTSKLVSREEDDKFDEEFC